MGSILISGPAGASKSALARKLLADHPTLAVTADFQSIYAALAMVERDPSGRYPLRDERLLPIVEYVRRAVITGAVGREIDVIATNSDGDPARRALLLSQLGAGATERIVDPGIEVVSASDFRDSLTGRTWDRVRECNPALVPEKTMNAGSQRRQNFRVENKRLTRRKKLSA